MQLLCLVEPTEPSPVDYEWNQYEKTEQLTYVKDSEIPVKPYHILTNKQSLTDFKSAIEDHNSQLLVPDSFKQRSLINMMDGVLEKKWEDELKKNVSKPLCMVGFFINKNIII